MLTLSVFPISNVGEFSGYSCGGCHGGADKARRDAGTGLEFGSG